MTEAQVAPKLDPNCQCICHVQPGVMHMAACCATPRPLDDPQVRRVYEIMNRDPSRFYADTTCALFVQAFRACLEAGVTAEGEK